MVRYLQKKTSTLIHQWSHSRGCYTITPLYEHIPLHTHLGLEFQHCLKRKGSSGSCVNLQLNKAVGLYSSFQRDECEMPQSAFRTVLEEESELKQHEWVLKPRKVVHSSRTLVFVAYLKVNQIIAMLH